MFYNVFNIVRLTVLGSVAQTELHLPASVHRVSEAGRTVGGPDVTFTL